MQQDGISIFTAMLIGFLISAGATAILLLIAGTFSLVIKYIG